MELFLLSILITRETELPDRLNCLLMCLQVTTDRVLNVVKRTFISFIFFFFFFFVQYIFCCIPVVHTHS